MKLLKNQRKYRIDETPVPLDAQAKRIKRTYLALVSLLAMAFVLACPAFAAAGDPLAAINNLSDFVFSAIKAIGAILLGFGIVQIGLALKGRQPARAGLYDLFRRRGDLLCKRSVGYDRVNREQTEYSRRMGFLI